MSNKVNIALTAPSTRNLERYFLLKLKGQLYNEPSQYEMPSRILAVSDIEGNFLTFRRHLLKNWVINKNYEWTFGDGHLVILGDCFDRGEQVIECLWLIYSLEEKARSKGGYVHFILGNHEIMNLNGDWRYIHPKYAKNIKSNKPVTALYDGNIELWKWLCTKNIMEKIGNFLFVHAGIAKELLLLNIPIDAINDRVRSYYNRANELFTDPLLSNVYNSENSPFWYRGYYLGDISEDLINQTRKQFEVTTIITGHTVMDRIRSFFNGKVINIDTDHASGNSESLLITNNTFYRVKAGGEKEKIM